MILWRDREEKKKAAAAFKPDAFHCYELGVIDAIVTEPRGGAQEDPDAAAATLRRALDRFARGARGYARRRSFAGRGARSSGRWASSADLPAVRRFLHTIHRVFNRVLTVCKRRKNEMAKLEAYRRKRDPREDTGAVRRQGDRRRADLRRPAPRRAQPPLRLPARAQRRARLVGGAEGDSARARDQGARRSRRGPSARVRARSRARSHKVSTVRARSRSGIAAPTNCSRRSATAG